MEFECDCSGTGYSGATCYSCQPPYQCSPKEIFHYVFFSALHPTSCEAYRNAHPGNQRTQVVIDPDGSGPLAPFPVTCQYYARGKTETFIHHGSEQWTEVDGKQEPGSFVENIIYDGDFPQIEAVVNRSTSCKQMIEYKCRQSRLFNSPCEFSRNNQELAWE